MEKLNVTLSISHDFENESTISLTNWINNSNIQNLTIEIRRKPHSVEDAGLGGLESIIDIITDSGSFLMLIQLVRTWIIERSKQKIADKKKVSIEINTKSSEKVKIDMESFDDDDKKYIEELLSKFKNDR